MANKIKGLTIKIGGDTTELDKALADVNKKSKDLSSELGDINRLLKMDPGNTDLLAQKQKVLAEAIQNTGEKLKTLKEAEKQVQEQFRRGKVSEEQVRALQREIIATEKKMDGYSKAAEETEDALRGVGNESKEVTERSGKLGQALGNAAKVGLQAITAAATAAAAGLVAAAESTREYRAEMGKLDTAFTTNGHSSEAAAKTYKTLQGVLGETDQAVEAANHLAQLCSTEEQLAEWTDIATGVYATFGASLPIEGLTEAANESAKVGQVTGSLADAISWASISNERWSGIIAENRAAQNAFNKAVGEGATTEEAFNAALAACSDESSRAKLITDALGDAYSKTADAYRETNAEIIRANEANEAWAASMADIGAAVEPILSDIKILAAGLVSDLVPGVQAVTDAFRGILGGDEGAAANLGEALSGIFSQLATKLVEFMPTIAQVGVNLISSLVSTLPQLLSTGASMIGTLIQGLLSALPQLLTTGGQVIFQLLEGIVTNLPQLANSALDIITNFVNGFQTYLPIVLQKGSELLSNFGEGIRQNLPSLVSRALDAIMTFATTLYDNAPQLISTGFELLGNLVQGILDCIPTLLSKVPEIVSKFANIINDNFPTILKKGFELLWQIIKGLLSAIPDLIANIPKIITAIVDVWEAFNWLQLGKKAITFLKDGVLKMVSAVKSAGKSVLNGITNVIKELPSKLLNFGKNAITNLGSAIKAGVGNAKTAATTIFNAIINTVKNLPTKLLSIGKDLVKGLWNGISDMTGWIVDKIQGFGESVLSGIKSFFGIKSPSRVFRDEVGKMLTEGMAEGIERNASAPLNAMQHLSNDLLGEAERMNGMTLERRINHTFAAPAASAVNNSSALLAKLDGIYERLGRLQIVLDSGTLVGETIDQINSALAGKQLLSARGV